MNGTERKRRWREQNPERSAVYERERAQARRRGYWGNLLERRDCASSDSYYRYESSAKRMLSDVRANAARRGNR